MLLSRLNGGDGTKLKITTNVIVTIIINKMRAAQEGIWHGKEQGYGMERNSPSHEHIGNITNQGGAGSSMREEDCAG